MDKTIIKVSGISKKYINNKIFSKSTGVLALDDINLKIYEGETLALVGESGCGKTTLGKIILGILEPNDGQIKYRGEDIFKKNKSERKNLQKNMQMVFQDPYSSLNPKLRIKSVIEEPIDSYNTINSKEARQEKIMELLQSVGLNESYMDRFPKELSGGERQRVGIARALALNPEFIVCDEPTSALDVSIQAQILNLLKRLQGEKNLTYLFITHDLGVVRYIADRVCVMYIGEICEIGFVEEIYTSPKHPYTKYLLDSVPKINFKNKVEEKEFPDEELKSQDFEGCNFYSKCMYRKDICKHKKPELRLIDGVEVYCYNPLL